MQERKWSEKPSRAWWVSGPLQQSYAMPMKKCPSYSKWQEAQMKQSAIHVQSASFMSLLPFFRNDLTKNSKK